MMEMQTSLSTCTDLGEDLAAIKEWGEVFKDPMELGKRVMNNYLLYGTQIMANINQERQDWKTQSWFNAGLNTAAVLNLLIPFGSEDIAGDKPASVSVVDAVTSISSVLGFFTGKDETGPACWKMAYGRGVGKVISACHED